MNIVDMISGHDPIVLSFPHSGTYVPGDIRNRMTDMGMTLPDTDWFVPELYKDLIEGGANALIATHSRYVIDLNRPPNNESLYPGQNTTGLVPLNTFAEQPIYQHGMDPKLDEVEERIEKYWRPYHDALSRMLNDVADSFGYAVLIDCHSIARRVPYLFDDALPDFNLGTDGGRTAPEKLLAAIGEMLDKTSYSHVKNGRFQGGYITRSYDQPKKNIFTYQIELVQETYMSSRPPLKPFLNDERSEIEDTLKRIYEVSLRFLDGLW